LLLIAGIVSQPGTLSYLELGWILTPDGQPHPVQDVNFKVIWLKVRLLFKTTLYSKHNKQGRRTTAKIFEEMSQFFSLM
jgi:hypothetical protein